MVPRINLILELVCRQYASEMVSHSPGFTIAPIISGEDNPQCRTGEVQSRVAQFNLYCQVISGILSAFVSPKLGALSDRYGRKRLIAVAGLGSLTIETLFIIAAKRPEAFPLYTLLLGYALDGLCGSFTTAMAIIHAYATDCSRLDQRSVVFAYFHSCLFVGVAIGPILAGYIIKITGGPLVVFIAALAVHLVFLAFLLFVIPESLSRSRQLAAREKHRRDMDALGPSADWINRVRATNIFEPLKILWPTGPGSSAALRRNLVLLSAVDTIVFGVAMGTYQVIVIYMNYAFGWRDFESGRFVSIVNVCRVFCLLIVLPLLSRLARGKKPAATGQDPSRGRGSDGFDVAVIRVGLLFDTAGYLGYSLSRTGALFTLSGIVSSIGGVASPTLQSSLTKHVGAHQTGQMLGAMGLLHALARVGGPLVFNAIYAATVGGFAQAVFVCLAATFGAAAVCTWFVRPHGELLLSQKFSLISPRSHFGRADISSVILIYRPRHCMHTEDGRGTQKAEAAPSLVWCEEASD